MVALSLLAVALVLPAAIADPVRSRTPYKVKETHFIPRKWKRVDSAPGNHVINLQIGVKQGNFAELERHLYAVSDPASDRYGQHLSAPEVEELVKPSDEALDLVHEWLIDNGIAPSGYSPAKDWVTVTLPLETVESLLDTQYHVYEHEDGSRLIRTSSWSLPAHLHAHIDTVQPTTSFFYPRAQKTQHIVESDTYNPPQLKYQHPSNDTLNKVCNVSSVTPLCFETLYSTKGYKTQSTDNNTVAFTNYLGEHPSRSDTEQFLAKYRPEAVPSATDYEYFVIDGGPPDEPLTPEEYAEGTGQEANLDVQAIAGISWATPIVTYSTGGEPPFIPALGTPTNTNEPYLTWVNYVLAQDSIPQVISTSYADEEQTVPRSYAERVCQQFAQIGARGTSLLFASGDGGVGDYGYCVSNDGLNTTEFTPLFPSSCPYVTTVGATKNFFPEVVAYRPAYTDANNVTRGNYTSGGGFSNYFPIPDYQQTEVENYIADLDGLYDGLYNKSGRGYPDIAAQGLYFAYVYNGIEGRISGTSASTPLLAGILSLVNDALLANGKSPLGFLNPWLYSKGYNGLTDIVNGSAVGCGVDGFPAVEGWDPVTGLGTPIFPKLVKLAGGRLH